MTMQERYLALTEKRKIPEVIVVEGKDDTANLRRFYEVDTYETRGSAIDQDDLERIATLQELRGVIVFTDPDYNGERIRKIIMLRRSLAHRLLQWQAIDQTLGVVWNLFGPSRRGDGQLLRRK